MSINYDELLTSETDYFNEKLPYIMKNMDENKKFCDPDFKPSKDIVKINKIEKYIDQNDFVWKRISEIININLDKSDKLPITQRCLGDCYFISFLRSLQLFHQDKYYNLLGICFPEIGYYEFYFFTKDGKQVKVFVDDYILVYKEDNSYPIFAALKDEDRFTVGRNILIEKAFAKMNKSYGNIEGGLNASFPIVGINSLLLQKDFLSKEEKEIYKRLDNELKVKNIILCGTINNDPSPMKGIFSGHMYSLLETEENSGIKILKLNNPHGENDEEEMEDFILGLEEKYKKVEKEVIEYNKNNVENGNVKIDISSLKKHYDIVEICSFNEVDQQPIIKGVSSIPPGKIEDLYSKRKNILDILWIPKQDKKRFIDKYNRNLPIALYVLFKAFMIFGTSKETFYNNVLNEQNPSFFQNAFEYMKFWNYNIFKSK